jgi:hypothetical protein
MKGSIELRNNKFCVIPFDEPNECYTIYNQTQDYMIGDEVEFEIIDEFTHPQYYLNVGWGDGIKMAKLL